MQAVADDRTQIVAIPPDLAGPLRLLRIGRCGIISFRHWGFAPV